MDNKLYRPRRCRFCKTEDEPLQIPSGRKRVALLICSRCGNELGVRYIPKNTKPRKDKAEDDHGYSEH